MAEDIGTDQDVGGGEAEPSLRDDIASAFEQVETRDAPPSPDKGEPATPSPAGPAGERARGPDGRFAPGDPSRPAQTTPVAPKAGVETNALAGKPPAPGTPPAGATPAPDAAATPALRAPASWKPGAREFWNKLPADVQQEVHRRESEVGRALQESARAREAVTAMQQAIAPFSHNIQASGGDAIGSIRNLLQADNTLRHGATGDKAQLVADVIKNYGVDIQALDSILAGQQVAPDPNDALARKLRAEMQQQLQPVMGFFNQMQGRRKEALGAIQANSATEVDAFGQDAAHEFFEDVREDMADIIDLFTQRNQPITLQQAYDRAIMFNPQVSEIVAKRAEAAKVNAQAQAAQRARRTAASIGGSPAPAGSPGLAAGADRRAEIEAAWDSATGS